MTEPDASAQLLAEARAYVDKYRGDNWVGSAAKISPSFDLLVGLLAALGARDAEIVWLKYALIKDEEMVSLFDSRPGARQVAELLAERDAEIARLTTQLHDLKVEFQDEECMTELRAEIARLRAPPGADLKERTRRARETWKTTSKNKDEAFAKAMQQYGDERAAAAREAELHRCAANCPTARALAAQPKSTP